MTTNTIFTLGYEKRSLTEYLQILKIEGIGLVVDVRKNPLSRKKGFSKRAFSEALNEMGIQYRHLPGLGIDSSLRKSLESEQDYQLLFERYKQEILPTQTENVQTIEDLADLHGKVVLTCFEKDHRFCHRHYVAQKFQNRFEVVHL